MRSYWHHAMVVEADALLARRWSAIRGAAGHRWWRVGASITYREALAAALGLAFLQLADNAPAFGAERGRCHDREEFPDRVRRLHCRGACRDEAACGRVA